MFSKDSILYQVNIISKIIAIILMIISISLIKIPGLIVLMSIIVLCISYNFKYLFIYSGITMGTAIITSFFPPFLWITKILITLAYLVLVKKFTSSNDLRYMLEVTLYKFQSKKITYRILYFIYFFNHMKQNIKVLRKLKDEYGIKRNWHKFILKKSYHKTKYEMQELMIINNLRFYNYSSKRTYLERPTWERWDTVYLLFHIILLVFIIVYGG